MDENSIGNELRRQLLATSHFKKVLLRKKPRSGTFWNEVHEDASIQHKPIIQPDLDLILLDHEGSIKAVELKVFSSKKDNFATSFYAGLGQGLAALQYGFDNVAVWQFFPEECDIGKRDEYGHNAWRLVRDLQLPVDFTYFSVKQQTHGTTFQPIQYSEEGSTELPHLTSQDFNWTWKRSNILLNQDHRSDVKTIRKHLLNWLVRRGDIDREDLSPPRPHNVLNAEIGLLTGNATSMNQLP